MCIGYNCSQPNLSCGVCPIPLRLQGSSQGHWRFPGHGVEQGYAYILTHPGTPCVFWDHLQDQRMRDVVSRLIDLRRRTGIHCRSKVGPGSTHLVLFALGCCASYCTDNGCKDCTDTAVH
jgi:hypothetical protein